MRSILLVCGLVMAGCIADRAPSADDGESTTSDAAPDGSVFDGQVRPDAWSPDLDLGGQGDAEPPPDAAVAQCERVFGDAPWLPVSDGVYPAGRFVVWHDPDEQFNWFDATQERQTSPAEVSFQISRVGLNYVLSRTQERLVIVDLETAEVLEVNGHNYGVGGGDDWVTWALPDGVFARAPDGRVLRLNDCVRNCEPPLKTPDALWTIGRARGEVEPVLYRHPLDGGEAQIIFGPIRDLALTRGRETVHWWTISNPPVGDLGRQVIAAGTARVPFRSSSLRPAPAWFEGTGITAFSLPEGVVVVYPEGREVLLEGAEAVPYAVGGMLVLDTPVVDILNPVTLETVLSVETGSISHKPAQYGGRALLSVKRSTSTDLIVVGLGGAELLVRVAAWMSDYSISPDERFIAVTSRLRANLGEYTTAIHDLRTGQMRAVPEADGIRRPVWLDNTHIGWVAPDGALNSYSTDGDHVAVPGRYSKVLPLGRASDGCMVVALERWTEGQSAVERTMEVSRQALPIR